MNYYIYIVGAIALVGFFVYKQLFSHSRAFKVKLWDVVGDELFAREGFTSPIIRKVDGVKMMSIKGEKETYESGHFLKLPSYKALRIVGGKKVYHLAKLKTGSFQEITKFKADGHMILADADDDFWKSTQQKALRDRHKNDTKWYEKPIFTIAVIGLICLMMVYVTTNKTSQLVAESRDEVLQMHEENIKSMGTFQKLVDKLVEGKQDVEQSDIVKPPE